jgi:GLPGLI family protein
MNYKKLIITTACSFFLFIGTAAAQNFAGIATYKSASKMSFSMDSTKVSDSQQEMMQAQLSKAMQKEYDLKFTVSESNWSEVESLGGAPGSSGMEVMVMGAGESGLLYKNIQEGKFERESNIFGKPFLVKDSMERKKWKLTDETKQIGEYTCHKATFERIVQARRMMVLGDVDKDEKEEEAAPVKMDTVIVTAWYTPEIPVSHGPSDYWGLPGLILEVNNGGTTLICSKIVLNPSEAFEITKPEKGKVVTQAEFDVVQAEKMEEMMKKYSGAQGGGATFRIGNQ